MGSVLNINSAEVVKYTKKLELLSKSALPQTAKDTLNSIAFDIKGRTLPEEFEKSFINRNKTFVKRFSKVQMARPGKIETMHAKVGMVDTSRGGNREQAGEDMTQQQLTGTIKGRSFIPLDTVRVSKSRNKNVRAKYRIKNLKIHANSATARASDSKQRFISTAIYAIDRFGGRANIIHRGDNGKQIVYEVQRGGRANIRTSRYNIKVTPLYSFEEGRTVRINKAVPFTLRASRRSGKRAEHYFKKHAKRHINRILK